jgi:hypothetical protein
MFYSRANEAGAIVGGAAASSLLTSMQCFDVLQPCKEGWCHPVLRQMALVMACVVLG